MEKVDLILSTVEVLKQVRIVFDLYHDRVGPLLRVRTLSKCKQLEVFLILTINQGI